MKTLTQQVSQHLAAKDDFVDVELKEHEDLNSSKLRINVTAAQINLARRIVKSVLGIDYLTAGGQFITSSIAFTLAHLVLVAKNVKEPYASLVKDHINLEWRANKAAYKRIAAIVNKVAVPLGH
jgi:hypothetical protein